MVYRKLSRLFLLKISLYFPEYSAEEHDIDYFIQSYILKLAQ